MRGALAVILVWTTILFFRACSVMWWGIDADGLPFTILCMLCIGASVVGLRTQRWGWAPFWIAVTLQASLAFVSWDMFHGGTIADGFMTMWGSYISFIMSCWMVGVALWRR